MDRCCGRESDVHRAGLDAYGNPLGDVTADTTFTTGAGASCAAAVCTPAVMGDYTITGTDGTATGTATLHANGAVDHLVLSPSDSTVGTGNWQSYQAEGFDAVNHDLGDVTSNTTFTIAGDGSCSGSSCSPAHSGDHTVTGTHGTATGTATLHVTAGLDHLVLSPAEATTTGIFESQTTPSRASTRTVTVSAISLGTRACRSSAPAWAFVR